MLHAPIASSDHSLASAPLHEADLWVRRVIALLMMVAGVGGALLIASIAGLHIYREAAQQQRLAAVGQTTMADVVAVDYSNPRSSRITYRFHTPIDTRSVFTGSAVVKGPAPAQVQIVYDPANPQVSRLAGAQPPAQGVDFVLLLWPLLATGAGFVIWRNSRASW